MANRRKTARSPRFRRTGVWILVLSVFFAELLFYAWSRMQCVHVGYTISQETRKQQELKTLQNSLEIELARLKAPETISRIARDRLELAMPEAHQIVVMP